MLERPVPSSLTVWAILSRLFSNSRSSTLHFPHSCPPLVNLLTAGGFTFGCAGPHPRPHLTPQRALRALPHGSLSHQPDLQTKAESQTWDLQALAKALVSLFCDLVVPLFPHLTHGCNLIKPAAHHPRSLLAGANLGKVSGELNA